MTYDLVRLRGKVRATLPCTCTCDEGDHDDHGCLTEFCGCQGGSKNHPEFIRGWLAALDAMSADEGEK